MHGPVEYVVTVLKLWGGHISGPVLALASIILTVCAAVFANDPKVGSAVVKVSALVTAILAVFLILVAQYDAWKLERIALEQERSRSLRPQLKGEAHTFLTYLRSTSLTLSQEPSKHMRYVSFQITVCNTRNVETNIRGIDVDGANLLPPCVFLNENVMGRDDDNKPLNGESVLLRYAVSTGLTVSAMCLPRTDRPVSIDLSSLRISLIDGLGDRHQIHVRQGSQLEIYERDHL